MEEREHTQMTVRTALLLLALFTLLCGIVYPLAVTGIAQLVFPAQANGSLIVKDGREYGSRLIGQPFSDPKYFWGRLSATSPVPYNASASSGSNYGPLNPALKEAVEIRIKALKSYDPGNLAPVPVDLVTFSGSGLDPHISPAAAFYQASRVAKYRNLTEKQMVGLIEKYTESRQFGILGEPRVNVLLLNLSLDHVL
jgi:K+-transporting ATPase ATPase C chain